MILWCDGAHSPLENMRRDADLLCAADEYARFEPVLRLFTFSPPGITLGRAQEAARVLDLEACSRHGIPWVTRPTGGRAIFHAQEWTYSLTSRIDDPVWGGSLATAYARASSMIAASLRRLGVPAEAAGARPRHSIEKGEATCFASTARHEVVLEGRKLVGSAQRRTARALLQQGSVLLGSGHLRLADFLALPQDERDGARTRLASSSIDVGCLLRGEVSLGRWAAALVEILTGACRVDGESGLFLLASGDGEICRMPVVAARLRTGRDGAAPTSKPVSAHLR